MATRDWSKVDWTNNEDNNLIREFLADSDNIMNCNQCPYMLMTNYYWVEVILAVGMAIYYGPKCLIKSNKSKRTK